jgi:hypothetical protein
LADPDPSCTAEVNGQPVANGDPLPSGAPGAYTLTVTATDSSGNQATASATYTVKYKVCYLYNEKKPQPATGAVPIKIQLCDSDGNNLSDPSIVLTAISVDDGEPPIEPQDSGSANNEPTFEFRWNEALVGYIYNLNVDDLEAGPHHLNFTVSTVGSAEHEADFVLK